MEEKKFIVGIKNLAVEILSRIEKGQEFCSLVIELCKDVIDSPMVTVDDVDQALNAEVEKVIGKEGSCFDFGRVINALKMRYKC